MQITESRAKGFGLFVMICAGKSQILICDHSKTGWLLHTLTISDLRFTIERWYNLTGTINQTSAKPASATCAICGFFRKIHTLTQNGVYL
jgi:hypothetical protein